MIVLGGGILYHRTQSVTLEAIFSVSLEVYPDRVSINGTGYVYNGINFSVLEWPAFGRDKVNLSLQYSENETRTSPVMFDVLLLLNQTQKVIEISCPKNAGMYIASIDCYFNGIKSGSYNLTISIKGNGVIDESSMRQSSIFIP
jgi:hypothetical protein